MGWRIVVGLVATIVPSVALAQNMPSHKEVCVWPKKENGQEDTSGLKIVSKERLAKAILKTDEAWMKLYVDASDRPSEARFAPQWRRIFTDPKFCVGDPGCFGEPLPKPGSPPTPPGTNPPRDESAARQAVRDLQTALVAAIEFDTELGKYYTTSNRQIRPDYLLGENELNRINCVGLELPTPPKKTVLKLPIRLRANSDDLNIDASSQKAEFKAAKPATITYTRDGIQRTNTTKLQAALGYAIPLDFARPEGFSAFHAQLVPYVSAIQSITKVDGKAATFAATNNIAVGGLFNAQMALEDMVGVVHVVSAKPQYLWNTKDNSEIASFKFIYQPWTQNPAGPPGLKINSPFPIGSFVGGKPMWVQLLFDLRSNTGEYTNKGTDPKTIANHISFERAGSRVGVSVATDDTGPHVVLNVTETMLYGFSGSVKRLSLFDSSLSYYFDSTSNFALTGTYKFGRDEDTAERSKTWTIGVSAKF